MAKLTKTTTRFKQFALDQSLVSIRRDSIDEHSIQGFVLAVTDELLLIQYVYDFHLDGLMVLRTQDVSNIKCDATNKFQKDLLISEQLLQRVPFEKSFDLSSWRSILSHLAKQYKLVIVEDELAQEPEFIIGRLHSVSNSLVSVKYFSGTGDWDETPTELPTNRITSCQVDTNYLNVYQRHFERLNQLG